MEENDKQAQEAAEIQKLKRRRLSVEEKRAQLQAQLEALSAREKGEAIRLLAHAHDQIAAAAKMPATKHVNLASFLTSLNAASKAIEEKK